MGTRRTALSADPPRSPRHATANTIPAADGRLLASRTFTGDDDDVVVITGGIGIRQGFYADLADAIRAHGPTVITFDYRGIGDSCNGHARHETAHMRE